VKSVPVLGLLFGALAVSGCVDRANGEQGSRVIEFEARLGESTFDCQQEIAAIGSTGVTARLLDLRFFVHDVELLLADGARVPFQLEDDGVWQRDGVALLDFEDGTGSCEGGTTAVRRELRSSEPAIDFVGMAFKLGVPLSLNHLDGGKASAPLNSPGMWWTWLNGYRHLKFEVSTAQNPGGFVFHLGATDCDGTPSGGFACESENVLPIEVELDGSKRVVFDAAELFADLDLSHAPDLETDFVAGCMAARGDNECSPMFAALGASLNRDEAGLQAQRVFRAETPNGARERAQD
jgi:uncharacterized repeat protein (TIGR04052 family)